MMLALPAGAGEKFSPLAWYLPVPVCQSRLLLHPYFQCREFEVLTCQYSVARSERVPESGMLFSRALPFRTSPVPKDV
jgi:hypothetical protein